MWPAARPGSPRHHARTHTAKLMTSLSLSLSGSPLSQFTPRPATLPRPAAPALTAVGPLPTRTPAARSSTLAVRAGPTIQVEVDKPLSLQLAPSKAAGGGLVVKGVKGNAAAAGISAGDTVVYTSSFFGDELWPSDNLAFTRSALANAPSPVVIVYVKGENTSVNVKRLPKKPAPQRFGRKLTAAQKALATHICVDCGYIYSDKTPFAEVGADYRCPQCSAPKKRFAKYDAESGKVKGGSPEALATNLTVILGLLGVAVLGYLGLNL